MYKNDKVIRRYSESFKLKILDELTAGKLNKYQLGKGVYILLLILCSYYVYLINQNICQNQLIICNHINVLTPFCRKWIKNLHNPVNESTNLLIVT